MSKVQSKPNYRLVLASGSPRRRDLLQTLGLDFDVIVSGLDESAFSHLPPAQQVLTLAQAKAKQVFFDNKTGIQAGVGTCSEQKLIVLGADTIVVIDGSVLGKPASPEEAVAMLGRLSGFWHEVYTGVAVVFAAPDGGLDVLSEHLVSRVFIRRMTESEIAAYVAHGEPMDKAGSYALQGLGAAFVERVEGCYTNVIGLSMPLTVKLLRQAGVSLLGLKS